MIFTFIVTALDSWSVKVNYMFNQHCWHSSSFYAPVLTSALLLLFITANVKCLNDISSLQAKRYVPWLHTVQLFEVICNCVLYFVCSKLMVLRTLGNFWPILRKLMPGNYRIIHVINFTSRGQCIFSHVFVCVFQWLNITGLKASSRDIIYNQYYTFV